MEKGKPMTTSVPTIAVKFHANDEQIEEVYGGSDDEIVSTSSSTFPSPNTSTTESKSVTSNIGDPDTSPFKYLPRLVKRSTSVDVSAQSLMSESPPSDPWRFLSDIKGKITKSVEEKITEIKARNTEEGSPLKQKTTKETKESKENSSSVSDSEDLSESSISKTCGIVSTTEGVEMSSDDETPSLDKDKRDEKKKVVHRKIPHGFSQRFRFLRKSSPKETKEVTVHVNSLSKLYNINTEKVEQALPEHTEEIESGVEALDDFENSAVVPETQKGVSNEEIIKSVSEKIDNIDVDKLGNENVVTVKEVTGKEIRDNFFKNDKVTTVFAPSGFVDLRPPNNMTSHIFSTRHGFVLGFSILLYIVLDFYWPYMAGMILGLIIGCSLHFGYIKLSSNACNIHIIPKMLTSGNKNILEIQPVKEYQPLTKFEGWINEYPDEYDPSTYHISKTQSAYLRLQGNLLRISHTKHKVPKRAMWNEPEIKSHLIHHRIYNMIGAKISLQPDGLAKIRHWSKKYPICITLSKDQLNVDSSILSKMDSEEEKEEKVEAKVEKKEKTGFRFNKKKEINLSQRFSKLTEEEDYDLESDSRASSPSPDISDMPTDDGELPEHPKNDEELNEFDVVSSNGDSSASHDDTPGENRIFIFGRTDREKEDWFRRLTAATHKQPWNSAEAEEKSDDVKEEDKPEIDSLDYEYSKYMQMFISKAKKRSTTKLEKDKDANDSVEDIQEDIKGDLVLWLNALIGRVLFDCMHDPNFTCRVRDRIQRKLSAIKLPYFIEELLITELSLGKTSPMIHKAGKPVLDERGLWVDLDLTYEGLVVLTLQTKLNLMKLKNPPASDKSITQIRSAIYHSDVDDSAESSSDEEGPSDLQNPVPVETTTGASGNSSKKFIKMVDKIAESRFFQAATENRYIKKAMEGVSNTDLRLKVEMRSLVGTLVLNMPTPPSDRVWVGFRPVPELVLSAQPIVGEKNISFLYVTSWIERKLVQEFQKIMVIPNMEDFIIPVMNAKLPE